MSTNKEYISKVAIGLLVQDNPGVMMKITGMFARRGYNIASITVGPSEKKGLSRITIVAEGDKVVIEQIIKQLHKLIDIIKVQHMDEDKINSRELGLIKISATNHSERREVMTLIEIFRGKVIDVTAATMTLEVVGKQKKIDSFITLVGEIVKIREIVRSGMVALLAGKDSISL